MPEAKWKGRLIWECKIGIDEIGETERGCDSLMRQAVAIAFAMVTGKAADFCFSGWNAKLTPAESKIVHKNDSEQFRN
jgi:hypothetical protein